MFSSSRPKGDSVEQRRQYKRKFTFGEFYRIMVAVPRAIMVLKANRRSGEVGSQTIERIMLAVTEVNGCAACSYAHTKMALREGMSQEEISEMLSGSHETVPADEGRAVFFAQHFADSKGIVDREAYRQLVATYGEERTRIMHAAMQVILFGNAYGIPYSAFISRLKGKPYRDSTVIYELSMLFWGVICFPFALMHALFLAVVSSPQVRFSKE